jgi:hypothetical protein
VRDYVDEQMTKRMDDDEAPRVRDYVDERLREALATKAVPGVQVIKETPSFGQDAPKLASTSPVLTMHDKVPDWIDEVGTLWACDSILRAKFPGAMQGAEHIKLMAYRNWWPGTVKVRTCEFNNCSVLVEEFNSELRTTVMKEHEAHPALVKWLNSLPDPVYIGVGMMESHAVDKAVGTSPELRLQASSWRDSSGIAWVCDEGRERYAPHVDPSDTVRLAAYTQPAHGRVRLELIAPLGKLAPGATGSALVNGEYVPTCRPLRTWLASFSSPVYVKVHVVSSDKGRA